MLPTSPAILSLNINEASKACGLSPSVLRIWELRYGWPNPKRKPNGYRAYNTHQVEELRRVAALVRSGTPISAIIVDGLPRWPSDHARPTPPRALVQTRQLPVPQATAEAALHRELIDALETRRGPHALELLQRIFWSVRPADEPLTALVPALVALAEHHAADRHFAEEGQVAAMVEHRCVQLLRMLRPGEETLPVVAATAADRPLAALVALVLSYRGIAARPLPAGDGPCVWVGTEAPAAAARVLTRVTALGADGAVSLAGVLDGAADALLLRRAISA